MKEYIKCKGDRINNIEIDFRYELGGWQYSTCTEKPRGYYISIQPMELKHRDNGLVSHCYGVYTGYYKLLYPCQRRSKNAEKEAMKKYKEFKKELVDRVVKEMNLTLEEDEKGLCSVDSMA